MEETLNWHAYSTLNTNFTECTIMRRMMTKNAVKSELESLKSIEADDNITRSYWKGYRDALCIVLKENPNNYRFKWEEKPVTAQSHIF
ncbi:MAG: hypothetical protein ACKD6O_08145 [Candidatus Bathyarchaeota archaeon]